MLKCRTILNELYKRNKKLQKHKSGGGKTHNKIIPKILSLSVSASLMLAMVPNNGAFAAEPTTFVTTAFANHWGRSDLRAYLNNGLATVAENGSVSNKNYGLNSTEGECNSNNTSGFAKQFSNAEYELVKPFTYATNVLNSNEEATAVYETTDRFWLPSGNYSNNQIISWGAKDISANSQYSQTTTNDKDRIIPISYWSYGNSIYSWLRSPDFELDFRALSATRGDAVDYSSVFYSYPSQAAACKIHLESVIFASAASAASIAAAGGAKKLEIDGTSAGGNYAEFGQKSDKKLPDYGMYLKTTADTGVTFTPTQLTLSNNNLTVSYSGGETGQYVVVHAFKEATDEDLTNGTTSFVAAQKLAAGQSSATINVSAWGLSSLDGYTIKVWMEDGSGSLAKATTPVTFVGTTKTEAGASTNARVFAMKADLQTSWGDLSALSEEDYNNVISGNSASVNSGIMGTNPTNQKIYFGAKDGQPLEFWIAGRETAANEGKISATGEIMTLYQAKSVETKQFNASDSNYPSAADFDFIPPQNLIYDGQPKEATVEPKSGITGVGAVTIKYFDSTGNQLETAPTDVGPYTVKIDVKEGDLYAAATDLTGADWNFTITEKTVVAPDEPSEPEDFNKSDWGDEEIHSGIKHYVDTNGTTSVEVSENGMIWLREESEGTAAWYGLDNTSGIFKKGSRFYVQWLNENDHPEAFANIDSNTKAEVEDDNGWLFKVGVIAPDGTRYEKLDEKVDLYVQIGDDWDRDDLAAFYISQGEDENIPVRYETSDYPEGEDEFGIMTLSHFSPYFIYDKLTDEEKAEFDKLSDEEKSNLDEIAKEMAVQQEKTADESTKTGDEVTYLTISGLGLIMTLALGLMLNSKINKKKSD